MFSNGAAVYDCRKKEIFYKNCLYWETVSENLGYLENISRFIELYIDGRAYVQKKDGDEFPYEIIPKVFTALIGTGISVVTDFGKELAGREVEKVIFYVEKPENCKEAFVYLSEKPGIFVTSSVGSSAEFTKAGTDKGSALTGICNYLNIDTGNAMALGDAGNDIPMLKTAGYGIAMANADEATKKAARFITGSNTDDGVASAVYQYAIK
jgi:Cof subfamily protein (haloacid dehalogenase superfamily)